MGEKDWKESQSSNGSGRGWNMGVEIDSESSPTTGTETDDYLGGRSPVTAGSSGTMSSGLGLFGIDRKEKDD